MAFASDIRSTATGQSRLGATFGELAARYARYTLYRKTLNELASLSNRELSDMGLCRSQIRSVAYEHAYDNQK